MKDAVEVRVTNPQRRSILAQLGGRRCVVRGDVDLVVRCDVPRGGRYELELFEARRKSDTHGFVGRVLVNGL